jgi:hypothetical protein
MKRQVYGIQKCDGGALTEQGSVEYHYFGLKVGLTQRITNYSNFGSLKRLLFFIFRLSHLSNLILLCNAPHKAGDHKAVAGLKVF